MSKDTLVGFILATLVVTTIVAVGFREGGAFGAKEGADHDYPIVSDL
ncbi:MAG: hypothetical protein HZA81_03940 [Candidatus Taylorbacteria bacterium]|nr:hypothetical protein [Candidatus Taylorbacteria bacterium]